MTWLDWVIAQAGRLIGGPLPTARHALMPASVSVAEDAATGGQVWTRVDGRRGRFPQVIHSAKAFRPRRGGTLLKPPYFMHPRDASQLQRFDRW